MAEFSADQRSVVEKALENFVANDMHFDKFSDTLYELFPEPTPELFLANDVALELARLLLSLRRKN